MTDPRPFNLHDLPGWFNMNMQGQSDLHTLWFPAHTSQYRYTLDALRVVALGYAPNARDAAVLRELLMRLENAPPTQRPPRGATFMGEGSE